MSQYRRPPGPREPEYGRPDAEAEFDESEYDDADLDDDAGIDEPPEEAEPAGPQSWGARIRRISPVAVILGFGSVVSLVFLILCMASHTTPAAELATAAVVTALIFGADGVASGVAAWRAGVAEHTGRAVLFSVVGGGAFMVSGLSFAGLVILVLVLRT
jgi:hypothetical protein